MTPSELLKKYQNLNVFISSPEDATKGEWRKVSVQKYHLGTSSYLPILWRDVAAKVTKGSTVTVETITGARVTTPHLHPGELQHLFVYPFMGKGSPEQVQSTIQLLFRYRKNKSTVEEFAGGVGPQDKFNFIGLDCNGFVGNYLQRVHWSHDWIRQKNSQAAGPDSLIATQMAVTTPVMKLSDFNPNDKSIHLFGFCSPEGHLYDHGDGPNGAGHIMITDPGIKYVGPDGVRVTVSESTAGIGPVTSEYVIQKVAREGNPARNQGAVFTVFRGSTKSQMFVKIGKLKP